MYTEATKQLLVAHAPPVLTLHFKRFQQVGFGLRKVTKHVDFPLLLDLAGFCSKLGEVRQKDQNIDSRNLSRREYRSKLSHRYQTLRGFISELEEVRPY